MKFQIKNYLIFLISLSSHAVFAQDKNSSEFEPADITTSELDNGMHYYIMHHKEPKDRVSFYFAQNVGSILEENIQHGLAHFLEHIAFNGTEHFENKQMLEYLEKNGMRFGAEINAFTSFDRTAYNINKVPVDNEKVLDSVLLVLHDWSGGLTLSDAEIDNERGVIKEEWRSRNTAQSRTSDKIFKQVMLKDSKYENRFPIGLMEVVDNFEYKELRDYYNRWYHSDMQAVIVVGDIHPAKMEKKIKTMFSDIALGKYLPDRKGFPIPIEKEFVYLPATDKELRKPVLQYYIKNKVNNFL